MTPQPEQQARANIDWLLEAAGWHVYGASAANIHAARGVAIREFPLPGYGFADYRLYGVETQSNKYTKGLPTGLPRWHNPLPFAYQSTGIETRFANGFNPNPHLRPMEQKPTVSFEEIMQVVAVNKWGGLQIARP